MNAITVDHVDFSYRRGLPILNDVSLRLADAQTHAIVGPSGCGKSTLLYLIGLMLRPQAGTIELFGQPCARLFDHERARLRSSLIGFVFQDAMLDQSLTVWENLIEVAPAGTSTKAHRKDCLDGLERLGLGDLRSRKAGLLSGGQAQRIALIRAIAKRPRVLLADEPTGNLDDLSAFVVISEILAHSRQPGRVGLIVTHDARLAERCDSTSPVPQLPSPSRVLQEDN
jgi:lipoprotein-releasing system ATP-binding protein